MGHGNHVAGTTLAGGGRPAEPVEGDGPGARIININVLDNEGKAQISDVIAGLEEAVRCKVDLVNMSLGAAAYHCRASPGPCAREGDRSAAADKPSS